MVAGPKTPITAFWMKKDTPIEVISGMSRGESRRGRYATRSIRTAVSVETMIARMMMMASDRRKLLSHIPLSENLSDAMNPVMAPAMKTSPWAKLMKPSTP
ncbi:MAG: hypothetical protein MAG471_01670 [Acidimicrobiaceae bacterium]|nr:hypothetical protein [Acidimicrobiaceae bacterium]